VLFEGQKRLAIVGDPERLGSSSGWASLRGFACSDA